MCGRYARRKAAEVMFEHFGIKHPWPEFDDIRISPSFNVAPQSLQPIIRPNDETGTRELTIMRWGLVPFWSKDGKAEYSTINAKGETVAKSPVFREAFKRRRCLVPADAFYEWKKIDAKTKLECPANLVPVGMRQTGTRGAWNGTREEAGF